MSNELTLEHLTFMQRISKISKEGAVTPTAPSLSTSLDSTQTRENVDSLQLWCCVKCIKLSMMSKKLWVAVISESAWISKLPQTISTYADGTKNSIANVATSTVMPSMTTDAHDFKVIPKMLRKNSISDHIQLIAGLPGVARAFTTAPSPEHPPQFVSPPRSVPGRPRPSLPAKFPLCIFKTMRMYWDR